MLTLKGCYLLNVVSAQCSPSPQAQAVGGERSEFEPFYLDSLLGERKADKISDQLP